jgi:LytS/YehU family sensor histidine kinase
MGQRIPPVFAAGVKGWAAHLAACVAIGIVHSAWAVGLQFALRPFGPPPRPQSYWVSVSGRFINEFQLNLIVYAAILAISYTVESRRRLAVRETEAARLSTQLAEAQLKALRRQLEPHFLFNTLHAIAGLVRDQRNSAAVGMIAGLSDLLRRVLEDAGRQEVPLGEELEFLDRYLEIQRVRFAHRLHVELNVPRELYTAQVPSLILQPMVENAIQHGIGKLVEGGAIRIAASRTDGALTIAVHNDGPALCADWDGPRAGIGISNTRARLGSLYGASWALEIRNHAEGGVEAVVTVPYGVDPR